MFLDHTQRRSIFGRTPLDEWSARRRDLYLTTHDTHNRQISMPSVGFEPKISAGERPQAVYCIIMYYYVYCIIMYTALLPPGGYPIAVNKYIISYHIISYHIISYHISYHIVSYHIISYQLGAQFFLVCRPRYVEKGYKHTKKNCAPKLALCTRFIHSLVFSP